MDIKGNVQTGARVLVMNGLMQDKVEDIMKLDKQMTRMSALLTAISWRCR
jgi:hypothetical protein